MVEEYKKALKAGTRTYRKLLSTGANPYPEVLDHILADVTTSGERDLGIVEIPVSLVIGTKEAGRKNAFSADFMPLLDESSEFGRKWINLYASQMQEGLRDPIKVYEYRCRFYVQEGNKRVSVMRYLKMPGILADVKRIMPSRDDSKESRLYYEFVRFFEKTKTYTFLFSEPGSYDKLLKLVGKSWEDKWDEDEIRKLKSIYYNFADKYKSENGPQEPEVIGEAFLKYLSVVTYEDLKDKNYKEISAEVKTMKKELKPDALEPDVEHVLEPSQAAQEEKESIVSTVTTMLKPEKVKDTLVNTVSTLANPEAAVDSLVSTILKPSKKKLKVAFISDSSPKVSGWAYAHNIGRNYVEEIFKDQIETRVYDNVKAGADAMRVIEEAIKAKHEVIFTTSPKLIQATVKMAIKYPEVYFFNNSLNFPYKSVRTYYARSYEAKFLIGLLAGAMADEDEIGYEADYPIYGAVANINAFALGVQMVNPKAKVKLYWPCLKELPADYKKLSMVSAKEPLYKKGDESRIGLYSQYENGVTQYATTIVNWGKFYEHILTLILNGTWKKYSVRKDKTINYYWGLSAEVIDLICSDKIPYGTRKLVEKFKKFITWGWYHPFEGVIYDQNGHAHGKDGEVPSVEEIISMDWLCDNIIGYIPTKAELSDSARELVELQGIGE